VSRTALYRHFADKSALLAGVAREGFQRFTQDLLAAWDEAGRGWAGVAAMGRAYVRVALGHPAPYRVMFRGFPRLPGHDPDLHADATASFQALVDALDTLQRAGELSAGDLQPLAHYVWATVHGIAMLAIDGQLGPDPSAASAATDFAIDRLRRAISA